VKNDEHQLWRDERDARLRERDREREPARPVRKLPAIRAATSVTTLRLDCPVCHGPVFTTTDSDRDRVDCTEPTCRTALVTRRAPDGSVSVERMDVAP
jgi:hypothetical protein